MREARGGDPEARNAVLPSPPTRAPRMSPRIGHASPLCTGRPVQPLLLTRLFTVQGDMLDLSVGKPVCLHTGPLPSGWFGDPPAVRSIHPPAHVFQGTLSDPMQVISLTPCFSLGSPRSRNADCGTMIQMQAVI